MESRVSRIISYRTLWEGRFLRTVEITFKNGKGNLIPWESVQRVGTKGIVAVVPFTVHSEVLLIRQFRPPVDRYVIEFPAGLNDKDEPLEEVAKRELLEETGFVAEEVIKIAEGPLSPGSSTEILTVYLARDVRDTGRQRLDDVEEIEVIKIPEEEFYERLFDLEDEETYIDLKIPGLFEIARRFEFEHKKEI